MSRSVVVVGAGLGGLSAACHLAGAGYDVTVVEAARRAGRSGRPARARRLPVRHRADGADDAPPGRALLPRRRASRCTTCSASRPVDPMYRACSPTAASCGSATGREAMTDEIRQLCGPADAAAFERLLRLARRASTAPRCRTSSSATTTDRSTSCARSARRSTSCGSARSAGSGRTVARLLRRRSPAPHLQLPVPVRRPGARTRPSPSTRSSPTWTWSTASSCPVGGMHALPQALAAAAAKAGVDLRYDGAGRAHPAGLGHDRAGARRAPGRRRGDRGRRGGVQPRPARGLPHPAAGLPTPRVVRDRAGTRPRPSCGTSASGASCRRASPTTTSTSAAPWEAAFRAMLRDGRRMPEPSLLVTRARRSTSRAWPPRVATSSYVLEPVPNLDGRVDWTTERARARDDLAAAVAGAGYPTDIEVEELVDPARLGGPAAWSAARRSPWRTRSSRPGRSAPATSSAGRPGWCSPGRARCPGVGVPMVLVSGMLAAQRVGEVLP